MAAVRRTARSLAAETAWHARLAELGARDGGEPWAGIRTPRLCWCSVGHECRPRPGGIAQGQGICRVCVGRDPATARTAWTARLGELGATDGGEPWAGTMHPRLCFCPVGHECHSSPGNVQQGAGICRLCVVWNVVYVVVNPTAHRVKFGITSGDPRPRLRTHHGRGYTEVVRTVEIEHARAAEQAILAALAVALHKPIPGRREYFDISALDLILAALASPTEKGTALP